MAPGEEKRVMRHGVRSARRCGRAFAVSFVGWSCLITAGSVGAGARAYAAGVGTATTARGRAQKKLVALSPWEMAERGREALEATAEADRSKGDYARAIDAYRVIYHANPRDVHAPAAVTAVAELLAEQGRGLQDGKSLQAALGQYAFLRKQYPGSSLGVQALLAEGQIEQNDLGDLKAAREKYTLLLKEHPKSEQAEEAKAGLESLETLSVVRSPLSVRDRATKDGALGRSSLPAMALTSGGAEPTLRETPAKGRAEPTLRDTSAKDGAAGSARNHVSEARRAAPDSTANPPVPVTVRAVSDHTLLGDAVKDEAAGLAPSGDAREAKRSGKKALVTGIRHWSTATYTRVAIDLGDDVTYEAARVPNPDRIYFDLHGTRLAQELVGKSFTVTDDGFLKKIRAAQFSDDMTRVVLDVNDVTEYSAFLLPNPTRLIIDIHGGQGQGSGIRDQGTGSGGQGQGTGIRDQGTGSKDAVEATVARVSAMTKVTPARPVPNTVATKSADASRDVANLSEMPGRVEATSKPTSKPISAVVGTGIRDQGSGIRDQARGKAGSGGGGSRETEMAEAVPARAAVPTADGQTSLVRALGLKIGRIVIDAGHGGHDSGTLGVDGIEEKDVVLDVALRLGKLLRERLGAEIIYTRPDDTFVPLETRTAIANKAQADLFLSIHANSSSDASARGVETYYLNFTSDPSALETAARENAVSDQSIHQLSDLVKKIALKDKIAESREFAADVETSLYGGLQTGNAGLKNRGVKKAPFVVLIGANMPSILAEISFVTNAKDAGQLREPEYRQRVAESLYVGVARYEGGLSGTRAPLERASAGR